ncbi:MAG: tail fiber domain-containing protein, partial [bacterium]
MVGFHAGYSNSIESQETFVGFQAGLNTHSGRGNTFVGSLAGHDNDFGQGNVFMGVRAGFGTFGFLGSLSFGCYNTFVGNYCGENNLKGLGNSFYGKHAGADNQNGNFNVSIGNHSGEFSTSQVLNTFIGYHSGRSNKGDTNVIAGAGAGEHSSGNNNCFYGGVAGDGNNGSYNTYIGHRANSGASNFTNSTALGANTIVTASKTMILGDNSINVGIGLSGDPLAPQSKLEINYSVPNDFTAPNIYGGTGFSGLQFRDLTADSHPIPYNPGKGVLSVDKFGVVIYVPDFKDIGFGLPCPAVGTDPLWEMPSDWRVGLNGNKLVFSDGPNYNSNSNHIGIGYDCNEDLLGKLSVREKDINTALNLSLAGYFISIADSTKAIGVCGMAIDNIDGIVSYGVAGFAAKAETNIGVVGMASGDTVGTYNIGVAGIAFGDSSNNIYNIGVYGQSFPLDDATAINKNWAGYFNGALYASSSWLTSDSIFKTNVTPITNSLEKIKELKPVSFLFNRDMGNGLGVSLPDREQYGFLAQNVSTVFPELVAEVTKPPQYDGFGIETHPAFSFKALNYNAFIGILTQGVKELDSMNTVLTHKMDSTNTALTHKLDSINTVLLHKNDSLRNVLNLLNNRLDQIENRLEDCCKASSGGGPGHSMMTNPSGANTAEIELENIQSIVLDQNVPNPFAESTVITYFIPDNINYSQIVFTDNYGRIMKTVDIKISGNGMIKVYAANLSSGTYT